MLKWITNVTLLCLFAWGIILVVSHQAAAYQNHQKLAYIRSLLRLSDSPESIKSKLNQLDAKQLGYYQNRNDLSVITTPWELGSKDWILIMFFNDQSKLVAYGIRTSDSWREKPSGSPADVGNFSERIEASFPVK